MKNKKAEYIAYQEMARQLYDSCVKDPMTGVIIHEVRVELHPNVQMIDDGAYVSAVVWVSKSAISPAK